MQSSIPTTGRPTTLVVLATALLGGCSHSPPQPMAAWRIAPVMRTQHATGAPAASADAAEAAGHVAWAQQLQGEGRLVEALRAWRLAAALAPQDAQVHHHLGVALAQQGQLGDALLALRRADALAPDNPSLLNNLGYVLLLDGQAEPARRLFDRVLQLAPEHRRARQNLARLEPQPALVAATPTAAASASASAVVASAAAILPLASASVQVPASAPVQQQQQPDRVTAQATLSGLRTEVVNGNGRAGAAARMGRWLKQLGVKGARLSNHRPFDTAQTVVQYRPGQIEPALALARQMAVPVKLSEIANLGSDCDLRVVLGHDMRKAAPGGSSPHALKGMAHMPAAITPGG